MLLSAVSDLGLHYLHMSNKKDVRLIFVISFSISDDLRHMLKTFVNSLNTHQARQKSGPDLDRK